MSYTASYIVNSSSAQGTTDFTFTFPYIKEAHIEVFLNYSKITQGSGSNQYQVITNVSPKLIRLNTGIASANLRVEVRRNSSLGSPLVDYADGSTLTANDLDTSALQSLYIDQELKDNQGKTVSVDEATGLPSMGESSAGNLRLTKVADPTAVQDAATKNYVDTKVFTSAQIQDGTITSADIANGAIVDADVNASAAISGSKLQASTGSNAGSMSAADKTKLDGIDTGAKDDQTAAEIRVLVESATDSNVFTDADHSKLNAIEAGATTDQTISEIKTLIAGSPLDASHLAANSVGDSEIATGALDNRYFTETESDARYFKQDSSETITSGVAWSGSDSYIATTGAIDARITDLVDDVGGFVPIVNETSFPNANPDINNGAGTLVSIKALSSNLTSNGSGVATIANGTVGNSTVTITGLANSTTYAANFGMIVETTSTLNTYTFHRQVPIATEVSTVAGSISNVNTVGTNISSVNDFADKYRIASSAPGSNNDDGDLYYNTSDNKLYVYIGSAWEVAASLNGSGGTITGDTTFNGCNVKLLDDTNDCDLHVEATASGKDARLNLYAHSGGVSQIRFGDQDDTNVGLLTYDHTDNSMQFRTGDSPRMWIDGNGKVGIGDASPSSQYYQDLVVGDGSNNRGITIHSCASCTGNLAFSDSTSGTGRYDGRIMYDHSTNNRHLKFFTATNLALTLDHSNAKFAGKITAGNNWQDDTLQSVQINETGQVLTKSNNATDVAIAVHKGGNQSNDRTFKVQVDGTLTTSSGATFAGNVFLHNRTSANSATPVMLDLGGQYTTDASVTHSNLKLKIYSNSSNNDASGITHGAAGLSYVGATNSDHIFYTTDDGESVGTLNERLRIQRGGDVIIEEHLNVKGAGTANKFETTGSGAKVTGHLLIDNADDKGLYVGTGTGTGNCYIDIDAAANRRATLRFNSAGTRKWSIGRGDSDDLSEDSFFIGTGNSGGGSDAKFTLTNTGNATFAGNATIGSLNGTLKVGGTDSTLGITLDYNQSGNTVSKLYANPTYTNTSALFHLACDGDANPNQLVLKGDGNVGIGTSSPTFAAINSIVANAAKGIEIHKDGTDTGSALKLSGDNGSGTKAFSQIGYSGANSTAHWYNYSTTGSKEGEIVLGAAGSVELYYDGSSNPHLQTSANGVVVKGLDTVTSIGSPAALQLEGGDANGEYVNLRLTTAAGGTLGNISGKAVTTGNYPNSVGELIFSVQNASATNTVLTLDSSKNATFAGGIRSQFRNDANDSQRSTGGTSNHWWKIGEFTGAGSHAFQIKLLGTSGFGAGANCGAENIINARVTNSTTLEGFWYTSTQGDAGIQAAAWKYTGADNKYEIWAKFGTFQNYAPIVDCSATDFTVFGSNTGSTTQPTGSTLFDTTFRLTADTGVQLGYDNVTKLETFSEGAKVSGRFEAAVGGSHEVLRLERTGTANGKYGFKLLNDSSNDCSLLLRDQKADATRLTISSAGNATFAGTVQVDDYVSGSNTKYFAVGSSGDCKWYHDGNNTYLNESGTGSLILNSSEVQLRHAGNVALQTTSTGDTVTGTVSDSKGNLREIPQSSKSANYVVVSGDNGKHIINSSGGWTINQDTNFTAGMVVTFINNSSSAQTIYQAANVTIYNSADGASGDHVLAGRGMATAICTANDVYYISGAGMT